jgi:hypothetical protein
LADPARQFGYEYMLALVDAIEGQVKATRRRHLTYRGADLSGAVKRSLFIDLVNDEELYEAFGVGRDGSGEPIPWAPGLRTATIRRLLGQRDPAARSIAGAASRAYRDLPRLRHRWSERGKRGAYRANGPTACFFLDHPKFVGFVDPVIERLEHDRVLLVALTGHVEEAVDAHRVAHATLPHGETPSSRAVGDALWEWPRLPIVYDEVLDLLRERQPGCAVVIEGNSPLDEVVNQACRALDMPCLCLQQGWSPIVHSGFRELSFTSMAVWGDGFRDLLGPYSPQQRFDVVGTPALSAYALPDSGASAERLPVVSFFLQPPSPLIAEDHQLLLHELILRASRDFPDSRVFVREHPGWPLAVDERERLDAAPNVDLTSAASHTLTEVIQASRVAVSIYSTSLLEAAALDTAALVFNPTSLPRYTPDLEELGVGVEVDDTQAALRTIDRLLHDEGYRRSFQPAMASFRDRFFAGADGSAPLRIAELITELGAVSAHQPSGSSDSG